jgi:hypothetical protein
MVSFNFEHNQCRNEKATGVDTAEFSLKHEGNKIQYSFNLERLEKLFRLENNIILKIADRHGWDTIQYRINAPFHSPI